MKKIDIATWKRKEHFEFYSKFDEPFFGIVTEIDCTAAYKAAKEKNVSFYADYLHKSLVAVNETEEFRYRIVGDDVILYDSIHAAPTIGREDGSFGFGFILYDRDFEVFSKSLAEESEKVMKLSGLGINENSYRYDVLHYSAVPWFRFTGLTHARSFKNPDGVPKISFGKASVANGKMTMPISVNGHHGLMDGKHVAEYLDLFRSLMNNEL